MYQYLCVIKFFIFLANLAIGVTIQNSDFTGYDNNIDQLI